MSEEAPDQTLINELVDALRKCIPAGLHATTFALRVGDLAGTPLAFSTDRVEEVVAGLSTVLRDQAAMLLGLQKYAGLEAGARRLRFAHTWALHYGWENVRRTQASLVLREVAAGILASGKRRVPSDYEVLDYSIDEEFPASVPGERISVQSRLIRALVPDFHLYQQQHGFRSVTGAPPDVRLLSRGHLEIANPRHETVDGASGYRYDFKVSFEPIGEGEHVELKWIRTTKETEVDVVKGEVATLDLTPTVLVHRAKMSARFGDRRPTRLWRYENLLPGDNHLVDPQRQPIDIIDGVGSAEWASPALGRSSGIGWQW